MSIFKNKEKLNCKKEIERKSEKYKLKNDSKKEVLYLKKIFRIKCKIII